MSLPAVVFPIGRDRYAIRATDVREVLSTPIPTRLPTAPALLLGLFNLRGEVVPLFDTAALLGVGHSAVGAAVIVVTTASGPAGLVASGIPTVMELGEAMRPSELRGTLGTYAVDGDIAVLVDVEALVVIHTASPRAELDALVLQ
ncbi:MAG TPA: chemotaxis protein CheW [Ilumatobacteraceae bacterium]